MIFNDQQISHTLMERKSFVPTIPDLNKTPSAFIPAVSILTRLSLRRLSRSIILHLMLTDTQPTVESIHELHPNHVKEIYDVLLVLEGLGIITIKQNLISYHTGVLNLLFPYSTWACVSYDDSKMIGDTPTVELKDFFDKHSI